MDYRNKNTFSLILFGLMIVVIGNLFNRQPRIINSFEEIKSSARVQGQITGCGAQRCTLILDSGQSAGVLSDRLADGRYDVLITNADGYFSISDVRPVHEVRKVGVIAERRGRSETNDLFLLEGDDDLIYVDPPSKDDCKIGDVVYAIGTEFTCKVRRAR
jgi:hypothetical protein